MAFCQFAFIKMNLLYLESTFLILSPMHFSNYYFLQLMSLDQAAHQIDGAPSGIKGRPISSEDEGQQSEVRGEIQEGIVGSQGGSEDEDLGEEQFEEEDEQEQ